MDPRRLPPDFREFLVCLNDAGAEYLLVGGHAVAYHGYPRATSDIDIWINRTPENAGRVLNAVRSFFNSEMPGLETAQLLDPETVTHFGARPYLIEVFSRISGGDFTQAWPARITANYDGIPVNIIGLAELKQNKQASARPKDLADLGQL